MQRVGATHLRVIVPAGNTAPFEKMSQQWQQCVRFDRPENQTSNLRSRNKRVTARPNGQFFKFIVRFNPFDSVPLRFDSHSILSEKVQNRLLLQVANILKTAMYILQYYLTLSVATNAESSSG